jgi:hypothetical protein
MESSTGIYIHGLEMDKNGKEQTDINEMVRVIRDRMAKATFDTRPKGMSIDREKQK